LKTNHLPEKLTFDWTSQRILAQLDNLYRSGGCYGLYDMVYDQLTKEGHSITYPPEIKAELWKKARVKFTRDKKDTWIRRGMPEERLNIELHKYFKSFLVAKYLLDKLNESGVYMKLIIEDSGQQVKLLNIVPYEQ